MSKIIYPDKYGMEDLDILEYEGDKFKDEFIEESIKRKKQSSLKDNKRKIKGKESVKYGK